ncbi:MAG: flagellar hook-length control protein FliK [Bacillota bacterium]
MKIDQVMIEQQSQLLAPSAHAPESEGSGEFAAVLAGLLAECRAGPGALPPDEANGMLITGALEPADLPAFFYNILFPWLSGSPEAEQPPVPEEESAATILLYQGGAAPGAQLPETTAGEPGRTGAVPPLLSPEAAFMGAIPAGTGNSTADGTAAPHPEGKDLGPECTVSFGVNQAGEAPEAAAASASIPAATVSRPASAGPHPEEPRTARVSPAPLDLDPVSDALRHESRGAAEPVPVLQMPEEQSLRNNGETKAARSVVAAPHHVAVPARAQADSAASQAGTITVDPAAAATVPVTEIAAVAPAASAGPEAAGVKKSIFQQIEGRLLYFRESGHKPPEMRLQLHPPEFGEITIRVFSRQGKLSAVIITELPAVREILQGNIGELRQRFEQCNLQLEQLDLFTAGREDQGTGRFGAGSDCYQWRQPGGFAAVNPARGTEPQPPPGFDYGAHAIDYWA